MSRISKITKKTFGTVMKEKKFEERKLAKEKENAIKLAKELKFDAFIKNTAKDMIQKSSKVQVQVFESDTIPKILTSPTETSVWAPWSTLFKK